jgi:hypothetical protein
MEEQERRGASLEFEMFECHFLVPSIAQGCYDLRIHENSVKRNQWFLK